MPVPDHVAIANLVYRYAELIDAGDFDGVGGLFDDAVITAEGSDVSWRGAQAITEMYVSGTRRYPDGTPRTKHATCRSYFTVLQQTDDVALQPIIAGRYHDEFRRAVRWHFARRHMIVDLVGDLSRHLLFDYRPPT
jgi:hypothetical protein